MGHPRRFIVSGNRCYVRIDMSYHTLILESHEVHGLEFQQCMRKYFLHVFAPYMNCSLVLSVASNPGNSQVMKWLKTIQNRLLKQWPGGCQPSGGRRWVNKGRSWRRLMRSYNIVRAKTGIPGVSSLLRASYKFHLWWILETWNKINLGGYDFFPTRLPQTWIGWVLICWTFKFYPVFQCEPKRELEYHISLGKSLQYYLSSSASTSNPAYEHSMV